MMFAPKSLVRAAVISLTLATAAAALAAQPRIEIEPGSLEFGLMQQFEGRSAVLTLSNKGDAPLKISEVEVTCGCTTAEMERDVLAPGESYDLDVTFNSQRFAGDTVKFIKVHSNDPFNSMIEVPVHAYVHVALVVDPPSERVQFGMVGVGQTAERIVTFSTEDVPELELSAERWSRSVLDVEILPSESGDPQEKRARLRISDGASIGSFREAVDFRTNLDNRPRVTIEAIGDIRAPIRWVSKPVNLRYIQRDQEVERIFEVTYEPELDFEVVGAEIDLPGFEVVSVERIPERRLVQIMVRGTAISTRDERAIAARGRMKGDLRLITDLEGFPEMSLSVTYMLKI